MNKNLIATLCAALFLTACGDAVQQQAKDDSHAPTADAGHGHGAGGEKLTHFTDKTELFVEFPRLVAGEKSAFAAHLTRLADFRALAAGKVSVVLTGGSQPDEVFSTETPTQPGIFRPEALPKQAGERELAIEVATPEFTVRHLLGPVTVYADQKAADAASGEHDEGGIGFTKEQQWKVDFATAEVVRRPIRAAIAATGTLRARPDGEALLTAPAPGQVQTSGKFPQLGQVVKKGDILAYFTPRLGGDTDMASLQAGARKARVALDLAVRERSRMESLFKDEAVPEKRLLTARAAEESARADFDSAQGRQSQYGGGAGGVPLRAPVSGTIADVRVSTGAFVQEGALLFHIADRRVLWLELRVPESEAARLISPNGATFRVEGVEQGFEVILGKNGRLIAIGGAVDAVTRTVPVLFEFAQPDERLRIGMAVKAQVFAGAAREAVAVPASAVLDENGVPTVFVMTTGESFERRPVRIGTRDGDWLEVVEGLEPGQRVVSRGAYLVKLAATKTGEIGHGHAH
ncbi:MAG: efflux RND transporter periplasmic adaptor subunit [Sulfurimicrobium sp.]|nr:efflux RND transporter periplasmic adaptor subunit [Sulfurimicrobium sp.]MDP2199667.1 efflux RND transporter periplasmic adaptor subunit [Sulfurimicrobium sp.]MDP3686743.1 efflux RND transporter periplasmic adaptor subunit [Sulfurimicrobium sp.]